VGGDDFGETLPWAHQILRVINLGSEHIYIDVTSGDLKLSWSKPRRGKA